jgi:hypothetical protein
VNLRYWLGLVALPYAILTVSVAVAYKADEAHYKHTDAVNHARCIARRDFIISNSKVWNDLSDIENTLATTTAYHDKRAKAMEAYLKRNSLIAKEDCAEIK